MDLIGIRVMMEDYELIELLGGNPVHLSKKGYTKLAESLINIVERPGALFAGEKRGREEGESVGDTEMIGSWHYKKTRVAAEPGVRVWWLGSQKDWLTGQGRRAMAGVEQNFQAKLQGLGGRGQEEKEILLVGKIKNSNVIQSRKDVMYK